MTEAADRGMGEKRYLLTLDEIMDIQAMVFLGAVLGRKSLAESSPSDEWLEARAHHERTCRNVYGDGTDQGEDICAHGFRCSECGASVEDFEGYSLYMEDCEWNYCPNCRSKVVGE